MDIHRHQHHTTQAKEDSKERLRVSVSLTREGPKNASTNRRVLRYRSLV
jgi:hypothetical protein